MRRRFLFNKNVEKSLVITANEPSTVAFAVYALGTCEYNLNNTEWVKYTSSTTHSLNAGETISFRGDLIISTTSIDQGVGIFRIDGNVDLYGSPIYLLAEQFLKNYAFASLFASCDIRNVSSTFLPSTTLADCCYYRMFQGCTSLTTAPELPATTLADYCYSYMFNGCTSLTTAPELPATTLANSCYDSMFRGCTSLTTAPELPATALANDCYRYMFNGCVNLTTAPELPATTLEDYCYRYMFIDCTSLTTAPELPATTLAIACYQGMFSGCVNLTTAPELPATALANDCYRYMFNGCRKLNYIKMLATDISATDCLYNWVSGVASTGTFVKNPAMTTLPTATFSNNYTGIPSGWTVVNDGEESGGDTPEFTLHLYTKKKQNYSVYHIEPCKETLALVDYFWENAVEGTGEWDLHLPAGSLYIDGWEPDHLVVFKNDPDRADFEVYKNYDGISMPRGQLYVTGEKKGLLEIYDEY